MTPPTTTTPSSTWFFSRRSVRQRCQRAALRTVVDGGAAADVRTTSTASSAHDEAVRRRRQQTNRRISQHAAAAAVCQRHRPHRCQQPPIRSDSRAAAAAPAAPPRRSPTMFYGVVLLALLTVVTASLLRGAEAVSPSISPPQKRGGGSAGGDAIKDHCNKTVDVYEDVTSPEVTNYNRGGPMTCTYRFRSFRGAPRDWVLRLRFKKFKVGTLVNATQCDGGYLQIVDGNAKTDVSNRREPGMFCGEAEQPQTFISETSYVKLVFHTDNFTDQTYFSFDTRAEQQMEVFLRYGQHPELYPNRRGEIVTGSYCEREFRDCRLQTCYVQSPAYPGLYPRALNCRYRLHTRQPFIKLYLQNEHFSVDGQRCENIMTCPMREIGSGPEHCPFDWLAVYDGRDENAPLIGRFCGVGKFPFSIIGTSQYMFVEFVSSPAGPLLNTGFHFNVGNWPGHVDTAGVKSGVCDWHLTSDALRETNGSEGIFLSIAHWYPPNTSCSYHIQGNEGEVVRLYFPSFRINRIEAAIRKVDMDCAESLTIYDSHRADPARIIKTFCDTFSRPMEKVDFVSTGRSLYVRFDSKSGSYSGSSLYYWAHYDFFNNTKYGEAVPNTLCDEVFYAWKRPRGEIRSPLNTMVYKRTGGTDVRCQFRFVPEKRLYARVVVEVTSITFKEQPYNMNLCTRCQEERVDKLVIWEERDKLQRGLACYCDILPRPVRLISSGDSLALEMIVQGQQATANYFKQPHPLFQANYEFVHGPLCGPPTIGPHIDGTLVFPHPSAIGYGQSFSEPRRERCIWELRVEQGRDLWMHVDRLRFHNRSCEMGKIEVYLAGRMEPAHVLCPENATLLRDFPLLSASELGATEDSKGPLSLLIQYTGDGQLGRNAFRLTWTELFHMPRSSDELTRSYLQQPDGGECEFKCAGDVSACIPKRLVCDGTVNCPNMTQSASAEQLQAIMRDNLRVLGVERGGELEERVRYLTDESPELCELLREGGLLGGAGGWMVGGVSSAELVQLLLVVAGATLAAALFLAICCRMCRRMRKD